MEKTELNKTSPDCPHLFTWLRISKQAVDNKVRDLSRRTKKDLQIFKSRELVKRVEHHMTCFRVLRHKNSGKRDIN